MGTRRIAIVGLLALVAGGGLGTVLAGEGGPPEGPEGAGPPAAVDPGAPAEVAQLGAGEEVYLVVGGVFPSKKEAEEANAAISFGELQGFYVAPVAQFRDLEAFLGAAKGDWILVSAFRTPEGAQEFLELSTAAGAPAVLTPPVENRGYLFVGLGQERAPDGSGPLRGPVAEAPGGPPEGVPVP